MKKNKYSDEALFCTKYLRDNGYLSEEKLDEITALLDDFKIDFKLIKVCRDYYVGLAEKLRELWPTGNKDGKYPWRDSVDNIAQRLKFIWTKRKLKEYSIDEVLMVARMYLSKFDADTKYMKTLKYFIYKTKPAFPGPDGVMRSQYESTLADMLESLTDEQRAQAELEKAFGISDYEQGTLI